MRPPFQSRTTTTSPRRTLRFAPCALIGAIALGSVACGGGGEGSFFDLGTLPPPPATATPYSQPTTQPTTQPTSRPSQVPTSQPTSQPTQRPTQPPASPTTAPPKPPSATPKPNKLPDPKEAVRRLRAAAAPSVKGLTSGTVSVYTPAPGLAGHADDFGGVIHHYSPNTTVLISVWPDASEADLTAVIDSLDFDGKPWAPPQLPDALCASANGVSQCSISTGNVAIRAAAPTDALVSALLSAEVAFVTGQLSK